MGNYKLELIKLETALHQTINIRKNAVLTWEERDALETMCNCVEKFIDYIKEENS